MGGEGKVGRRMLQWDTFTSGDTANYQCASTPEGPHGNYGIRLATGADVSMTWRSREQTTFGRPVPLHRRRESRHSVFWSLFGHLASMPHHHRHHCVVTSTRPLNEEIIVDRQTEGLPKIGGLFRCALLEKEFSFSLLYILSVGLSAVSFKAVLAI